MKDPTVALPLHFTLETSLLTAAALVLAWAVLRRNVVAALGALALSVAQGLHAGAFIAGEDDPALVVLRAAGLIGLAIGVLPREADRPLFAVGLVSVAGGVLWGTLVDGGPQNFAIAPHVLFFVGAAAWLLWVAYQTRPSVRLRVIAAFVAVLAMAIVVAGGAIARVAAIDSRTDQYTQLGAQGSAMDTNLRTIGDALSRNAASYASALSIAFERGTPSLDTAPLRSAEWGVLLARDGAAIDKQLGATALDPYTRVELLGLDVTRRAQDGDRGVDFATSVEPEGLVIVTAAPVYRPTDNIGPDDLRGLLVLGRTIRAGELPSIALRSGARVAVRGERHFVASDARLPSDFPTASGFHALEVGDETWYSAVLTLPEGNVRALVAAPDDVVFDAATDLVRAFLVAVLAAALVAVIAALWLSARITRPLLALADDAERVKSDFLSSVSHELRTPLTPIRGYTELLRRGVPARSRPGYLDEIGNATQRLERIVSLLVDVAAMDAGRYQIAEENTSVRELFEAARDRWSEAKRPAQVEIVLPKEDLAVRADPAAISRVLDELIDNAFKFAPDSTVELGAERDGRAVALSVHDSGPGIDPERLAALKAPFATGERGGDTKRYGGLGLGLSFVEGVLAAHGSRLAIDSEPGQGTTCRFTLRAAGSVTAMPAALGGRRAATRKPAPRKRASRKR